MTDHESHEMPEGDADQALARKLRDLGPLMRRTVQAEADPPDDAFLRNLWDRLAHEDVPGPMAHVADDPQQEQQE